MGKITITKEKMLEQILAGLRHTTDSYKRQWLLGAQSALLAINCEAESAQGVDWNNEINLVVGEV